MRSHNFENLDVWKRGCSLAVDVCVALHGTREFELKNQATRSALSIPSNIAEGAERRSDADFVRFLEYSKGSCGELRTQLMVHHKVCLELGIEQIPKAAEMIQETRELSSMLGSLIHKLSQPSS